MQLLVTGGRNFYDKRTVDKILSEIDGSSNISGMILGDAFGADALAKHWAETNRINHIIMYADWDTYGRKAGPIRNSKMVDFLDPDDLVLAFPGGTGTANCVNTALNRKLTVRKIDGDTEATCEHIYNLHYKSGRRSCMICNHKC